MLYIPYLHCDFVLFSSFNWVF